MNCLEPPGPYSLQAENDRLKRQVATLTAENGVLVGFLVELQQWGASNCRCSFNAHSLLEQLRRGVSTEGE